MAPVSTALDAWTAATLPPDWTARRLRWEVGHAMHALCLAIGLEALLWAALAETPSG